MTLIPRLSYSSSFDLKKATDETVLVFRNWSEDENGTAAIQRRC